MYRNIDEDIRLFKTAQRYWNEEQLTKEQVHWLLKNEGYSEKEVDNAINDYYMAHIRPNNMVHYFLWPVVLLITATCLVIRLYYLIK